MKGRYDMRKNADRIGLHIVVSGNNNPISRPYLSVMEYYDSIDENGKKERKKHSVMSIGYLDEFDDGMPDYIDRLRKSFAKGDPLIDSLKPLLESRGLSASNMVTGDDIDTDPSYCDFKNVGYFLLNSFYDALGVKDMMIRHKSRSKIEYDLNGITKVLVFGRAISPASKFATFAGKDNYIHKVTSSDDVDEVYRALDVLNEKSFDIQKVTNSRIASLVGRDEDMCFYDVTNFWFEIPYNDPDIVDENGEVTKSGLRKKGPSKENRKDPIVQMGLFTDTNGIPISFRLFSGNTNDQTTLRPTLLDTFPAKDYKRIVVIADGGLNSDKNVAHITQNHHGYIFAKSVWKSTEKIKGWLLKEGGYVYNKDRTFKVKSQIVTRTVKDEKDNEVTVTEKLVGYWSEKFYNKEFHAHQDVIKYLDSVIENPTNKSKRGKNSDRFLVEVDKEKKTCKKVDITKSYTINDQKLAEHEQYFGFNLVFTSEINMSDSEVLEKYHRLSMIEDCFRVTKSDLAGRPVYVRTPAHINAHFLVCFLALQIIRLIQMKVLDHLGKSRCSGKNWESGLSAERIMKALSGWCCHKTPDGLFHFNRPDEDLRLIMAAFGVDYGHKRTDDLLIRNLKHNIDASVEKMKRDGNKKPEPLTEAIPDSDASAEAATSQPAEPTGEAESPPAEPAKAAGSKPAQTGRIPASPKRQERPGAISGDPSEEGESQPAEPAKAAGSKPAQTGRIPARPKRQGRPGAISGDPSEEVGSQPAEPTVAAENQPDNPTEAAESKSPKMTRPTRSQASSSKPRR
jgi:transposase